MKYPKFQIQALFIMVIFIIVILILPDEEQGETGGEQEQTAVAPVKTESVAPIIFSSEQKSSEAVPTVEEYSGCK